MNQSSEFKKLSSNAQSVKVGRYRHFKGNEYEVLGIGKHTETLEEFVIYRPTDKKDGVICIRPLANFLDIVDQNGYHGPRFIYLKQI